MFNLLKFKRPKRKEFAVIGLGGFGRSVVHYLSKKGYSVLALDKDPNQVQLISEFCTQAVVVDATREESLQSLDIVSFDTVVVAIDSDFESNLITTTALKALGVQRVICKALTQRQKDILLNIGADRVIMPEADAGRRLGLELAIPNLLEQISFGDSHDLLELRAPDRMVGKTLRQLRLRNIYGANVVALRHENLVKVSPDADQAIEENDILVLIGPAERIQKLTDL
jgi:trk system potassium uptake protein TrkA